MLAARPKKAERTYRFAPSPNGFLHRGHAYSALLNFRAAKVTGGRFLLRIEDIDRTRARQVFEDAIFEDLGWLGLTWEEPVLRQRDRFDVYANAVAELEKLDLLYPAFLSRTEIDNAVKQAEASGKRWPRDPDGAPHYPGPERGWSARRRREEIGSGKPYALRLDMARALANIPSLAFSEADPSGDASPVLRQTSPAAWGDVMLARKEMPTSYHLAVVADDAFQGVTDVVRGKDLEAATSVHRLLQALLGLPEPTYFHHRLILDESGQKLSKSRGSETIRGGRNAGESAEGLIAGLGL